MTTLCDSPIKRSDVRVGASEGFMPSSPVDMGSTSPSRSAFLCFTVAANVHTHRMRPREYFCVADNVHTLQVSSTLPERGHGGDTREQVKDVFANLEVNTVLQAETVLSHAAHLTT